MTRLEIRPRNESGDPDIQALARTIRKLAVVSLYHAGSGYPGGALSASDVLAYLYGTELNLWPGRADDPERDRFVLSKGHACACALRGLGGLGLHRAARCSSACARWAVPCRAIRMSSTCRLPRRARARSAKASRSRSAWRSGFVSSKSSARVYVMLGDGELQEGEVWEGAMCAAPPRALDNLCAIIDYNKLQSDDLNDEIMGLEPLADKWRAFGWHVLEIDGHDTDEIGQAFSEARREVAAAHRHHRPHGQGQGRELHGKHAGLARQRQLTRTDCERALADLGVQETRARGLYR